MLKPQPPAMPMAANDSNAIFHEALALLDEFYTIDGIDLVPEPWYGKLEPVPLPQQPPPVHVVAPNFPSAPRSTSNDHSDHQESDDIASVDTQSTAGHGVSQPRRNRQREELLRLREEAVELEKQMSDLRQRRQTAAAAAESMPQEERDMMALWEKIAVRQQSERQRVEIENAKLKELFAAQTRVAQELRRLLEKQMKAHATVPSLANGASVPRRRCQLHEMPGVHIFEHLINELENLYAQTDSALATSGVNAVEPPFRTTQLKLDDHAGVRVELIGRRIVPFDVHEMSKAIWSQAHEGAMHPYYYFYDEAESPEELIIRHCGIRAPHGDTSVDLIGKHCSRRFVEQDRVVVAWCAMLEPQVYSGVPANDLRFRENGWVVLTQASAPGATEVRMFRVISPDVPPGEVATADWRIYALIDFVSNVIHSQGTLMQQRVENALLENSLKRQMSGDSRAQEPPRGKIA